ncbi:polyribonucleotide nucleotidyltransferase, partial [Fibrobacterota bacterium]
MSIQTVEAELDGIKICIETGRIARQAGGSVVVRIGDTMLLTTACSGAPREGIDFFPLTVEFIAKTYAAGKIPGGFFKREGRPSDISVELLISGYDRIVDRPIRPLFPESYNDEVQIINTVISADEKF